MTIHLKILKSRHLKFCLITFYQKKKKMIDDRSYLTMNGIFIDKYPIYFDQIVYSTVVFRECIHAKCIV